MIAQIKLSVKRCHSETLVASPNVHPVFASTQGPMWVMHGSHFCSEALIQGESFFFFFFLEGIPLAWLLWYRLAACIYIHTVTRKPAPTAEKEAHLFSTEVSLQNWNKLMQPATVGIWTGAGHVVSATLRMILKGCNQLLYCFPS